MSQKLTLSLLATVTSEAYACGGPGPEIFWMIGIFCLLPGFVFGLVSGLVPRLSYGASLASMLGILFLYLVVVTFSHPSFVDQFLVALFFVGVVISIGHAFGFALSSGARTIFGRNTSSKLPPLTLPVLTPETQQSLPEDQDTVMRRYNIKFDGKQFVYDSYSYDLLSDAVSYAALQEARSRSHASNSGPHLHA